MRDPAAETLPWEAQVGADDAAYRAQIGYLFERSPFYRDKLAAAGFRRRGERRRARRDRGAAADREGRAARQPDRRSSRSARTSRRRWREVVRIYSTSGTTGSAELHPADRRRPRGLDRDLEPLLCRLRGRAPGSGSSRPMARGRSWPAAALDAFAALGLCHIPVGPGNTEQLLAAVDALAPDAIALTPSYALHLAETAAGARDRPRAASSVARLLVAGEPGGGEPELRGAARGGLGRDRSPRRWGSATSRSRSGASARRRRGCISPAAASSMSS